MNVSTTFRLPCYQRLVKNLGRTDAAVECTELAVRELIFQSNQASPRDAYVNDLSKRHAVRVNTVSTEAIIGTNGHLHILAVYAQAEDFLESYRRELPRSSAWTYDGNDNKLTSVIKNIGGVQNYGSRVGTLEVDLFGYYRLVRNRFLHPEISDRVVDAKNPELRHQVQQSAAYSRLQAPNLFRAINFDDFILFTRTVKQLAHSLCIVSRPSDEEIANWLLQLGSSDDSDVTFASVRRVQNNQKRRNKALDASGHGKIPISPK